MKKICLSSAALAVFIIQTSLTQAQEKPETEQLAEMLSLSYGAPVEVKMADDNCQITYSAVEIKEVEPLPAEEFSVDNKTDEKVIVTPISATKATCERIADFNDLAQYKIKNTSLNKIKAQIYQNFELPLVKDIKVKTFSEEQTVVPALGLTTSQKINIAGAAYTEIDDETNLKQEIANLQSFSMQENVVPSGDTVKYLTDMQLGKFNLVLPIFSFHIDSEHQAAEVNYANSAEQPFDFNNLWQNILALKNSRSRVVAKGIRLKSDMFGFGMGYDIEIKGKAETGKNGAIDSISEMTVNHLSFSGDILPKHQQPQSIVMKMFLNDLQLQNLSQLSEIQQEAMASQDGEIDQDKVIAVLDDVLDTAKLKIETAVNFAGASIKAKFNLYRKHYYLQGEGTITINNLFNIFPQIKECQKNPEAEQCMQTQMLSEFFDIKQNSSINKIRYTSDGIYVNNKKVGEPIKLDLREIIKASDDETSDDDLSIEMTE